MYKILVCTRCWLCK